MKMEYELISHEEVMRIARQAADFVKEERKIKPFYVLAAQIYSMRKKKNLTQVQLARKVKTFQTRISKIENGDLNPSLQTIIDIADALGCQVSISINECEDERVEALRNHNYFRIPETANANIFAVAEQTIIESQSTENYVLAR